MYTWVLALHSGLRWLVLLAGIVVLVRALQGRSGRPWTPADERSGLVFVASIDLQLLIGLILLFFGPVTVMSMQEPEMMFRSRLLRFFTLEHPIMMLIAVGLAHTGRIRIRRGRDDRARHQQALWFFGASMALILAAIPWPFLSYGRPLSVLLP